MGLQENAAAAADTARAAALARSRADNEAVASKQVAALWQLVRASWGARQLAEALELAHAWFARMGLDPEAAEVLVNSIRQADTVEHGRDSWKDPHYWEQVPAQTRLWWVVDGIEFIGIVNNDAVPPSMEVVTARSGLSADTLLALGESLEAEESTLAPRQGEPALPLPGITFKLAGRRPPPSPEVDPLEPANLSPDWLPAAKAYLKEVVFPVMWAWRPGEPGPANEGVVFDSVRSGVSIRYATWIFEGRKYHGRLDSDSADFELQVVLNPSRSTRTYMLNTPEQIALAIEKAR